MTVGGRRSRLLLAILLFGLLLRVVYALDQPTLAQYTGATGGDSSGYLANGAGFFSGQEHGWIRGIPFYNSNLKPAPLYVLFVGLFQVFLPDHEAILAIRLLQCLVSIATAWLAYRLATTIADDDRAGILSAALMALHPAFNTEPAQIGTETLYIFFLALGLWLYAEFCAGLAMDRRPPDSGHVHRLALAGVAFGLATLTRGVAALFPLVLALHLVWLGASRKSLPRWRRRCALLLVVYAAMVSTWTIYNLASWNRLVIVSDQLMGALWRGAESDDGSPQHNDSLLLEGVEAATPAGCEIDCKYNHATETYVSKISDILRADFGGYLALRVNELAYAILQPHGTAEFGDTSVVVAARAWLAEDRSPRGLVQIARIDGFLEKLAFWIFHFAGIGFGLLGIFWSRRAWRIAAPVAGFAFYTIAIHFFLLALPRYLFPIELVWLVFAGVALARIHENRQNRRLKSE